MSNSSTDIQFDQAFQADQPATRESLDFLYTTLLGRKADASAHAYLQQAAPTISQVERMIMTSPEYRKRGRLILNQTRTPYDALMLHLVPARVILCPIAKVANTSLKDWVLRLVGEGREDPHLSHTYLDSPESKLQGRRWSAALGNQARRSPDWASAAIVRNPAERLVSCYCDKFGRNRFVTPFTAPVYAYFNDGAAPDQATLQKGITFRQFCHYINNTPRSDDDCHWVAQWEYLKNRKWDRLFALEHIGAFEDFVRARLPEELQDIRLGLSNRNKKGETDHHEDVSDMLPDQWQSSPNPPYSAFLADDIRDFIQDYYSLDYQLYEKALAESGN